MAGESPRQVVIGLLRQLLERAEAGAIDGLLVGVVSNRIVKVGDKQIRAVYWFAAGDEKYEAVEEGMAALEDRMAALHWREFHWQRIPQLQALP